jgi:hypothetical protein
LKVKNQLKGVKELHVGGSVEESRAGLYIYNKDIDIPLITKLAGREPTESHIKGEVIGKRRPAFIGLRGFEAPSELSFSDKLTYLVKNTSSKKLSWEKIAEKNDIQMRCVIFLHSWNEGFDIPSEIIAEIGKRHWKFGLSMYSAEGNEILDAFLSKKKKKD